MDYTHTNQAPVWDECSRGRPSRAPSRILIVDDEPEIRTVYAGLLTSVGFEVQSAANGRAALKVLGSSPFSLVLCDILMPEVDGLELIGALRVRYPSIKIIAMSGGGSLSADECLAMAGKLGAIIALRKPFSATQLLRAIVGLIGPAVADGDRY